MDMFAQKTSDSAGAATAVMPGAFLRAGLELRLALRLTDRGLRLIHP